MRVRTIQTSSIPAAAFVIGAFGRSILRERVCQTCRFMPTSADLLTLMMH
jgi:hypothetical protein